MKSAAVAAGQTGFSEQYDALRSDAYGGSQLLAHQQLGVLAFPSNPANGKTWTLTINGTAVSGAFVTAIGSTPGNVLIGASAAATAKNLLNLQQNPQATNSTQVALSNANIALTVFCGYALNGTSITIYSLNSATYAPLTSFTASTNATSGTWTANTMALYVEPGTYYIGITQVKFAGGNTPTITAPSSHPRIDLVTVDSSGTIALVTGTEATSPAVPSYPTNKIVVCEIFNVVGETIIRDWNDTTQGYIQADTRPFNQISYIGDPSQIASGVITNANLNAAVGIMQTGMIVMWTTTSPPPGFVFCDGSSLLRSGTYAALFAVIGTTFGSADGTHFNVPDFRGRVPIGVGTGTGGGASGSGLPSGGSALTARALADWVGEETHTLTTPEIPSHTHPYGSALNGTAVGSSGSSPNDGSGTPPFTTAATGGGGSHNNVQPTLAIEFIIHI